jgi:hypothetical protein
MKDSHIYNRMNDTQVVKVYLHMIKENPIENVKHLVGNITLEASDHPRYPAIMTAYEARLMREQL